MQHTSSNIKFHQKLICAVIISVLPYIAIADESNEEQAQSENTDELTYTLTEVNVSASADASADGLSPLYAGGQVARGGRVGILGTQDNMDTPFSITSYTNELIQDKQARSVGEVLLNDPSVRVSRGFGNFQESYFIRGFILSSDDVAYNGLYSLLPRQYIATELFERVELLRGASAFLTGANPGGGGIGGAINLVPKRALNEPLTRIVAGASNGLQGNVAADISRRFGENDSTGIRFNVAHRDGNTAVDDERSTLDLAAVAVDWHSQDNAVRLSGDVGWQDNKLKRTRTNVTLSGVTKVPSAPDASNNYAKAGTFSNERDVFGTFRGEFDVTSDVTAWAAYGFRRSKEANSLGNLTVTDGETGDGFATRFDNTRKDDVDTGEIGLRGEFTTGPVGHKWVASSAYFKVDIANAYAWDFFNQQATNLYNPDKTALPAIGGGFSGGDLSSPRRNSVTRLKSYALSDTLSFLDDSILLTLGARHQKLESRNYAYGTAELLPPVYSDSRTSPVIGAVLKANEHWSIYANYIEGLTRGETAPSTAINNGEQLAPYVSKQKEVGLKYDGGHFGAGLVLFSTDKPRGIVNDSGIFTSSGEDQHNGLELTMFGEAYSGLRLLGGATLLDAKQDSTGLDTTDGKRVIGVPTVQANLGVEWDVPGIQGLTFDSRVIYTGYSYADAENTLRVPGWTRIDIGARYLAEIQNHLVTLRARIDNIADRDYWASVGGFPGRGYLTVGAPRTVSVSATLDF